MEVPLILQTEEGESGDRRSASQTPTAGLSRDIVYAMVFADPAQRAACDSMLGLPATATTRGYSGPHIESGLISNSRAANVRLPDLAL